MNILSIDSSTAQFNIALLLAEEFHWQHIINESGHSENIILLIEAFLEKLGVQAESLDLLVTVSGPGSFTGLRVGLASMKGLSLGLNIPLVLVSTLDVWAHSSKYHLSDKQLIIPLLDARKGRIYTAFFERGQAISPYCDISINELIEKCHKFSKDLVFVGSLELLASLKAMFSASLFEPIEAESFNRALLDLGAAEYAKNGGAADNVGGLYLRESTT